MPNPSVSAQLFQHARRLAPPFLSHEGLACAPIPFATFAHDMLPLRSHSFRQWLLRTFLTEHELFPSHRAIRAAIQMLDALATDPNTPRRSIDLRISSSGSPLRPDAILLDLANADGDAVEITAAGWNIRTPSTPFRRSRTAQPLPHPESAPTDDAATQPLTLPGFALQPACLAWLLAALRPAGPYPILILQGPPASGKTLLARMLRSLVDPAGSPFCRAARNPPDLLRLAWNNYVLAFDHVTHLPADISDSLCRLSAGAGFAFDEQTDGSDVLTRFARPIILTTPACRSTQLRNRAIVVDLPRIPSQARRGEAELTHEFWDAQPRIFGRLCSAISYAMSATPASTFQAMPAFVDAATWAVAAAPSLGITQEQMKAALTTDAFAQDLAAFVHETGTWEGTATELLSILQARGAADLPATAARLSRKIHISALRAHGVEIKHTKGHNGHRLRATVDLHATVAEAHFA